MARKVKYCRGPRGVKANGSYGARPEESVPDEPFLFDKETPTKPTSFQVQFLEDGEVFCYGVCHDANRIHEEWLDVYKGKRDHNVFSRVSKDDGTVEVTLGPAAADPSPVNKLKAL